MVRPLVLFCCACGVLGHLAPVHRCARLMCSVCGVLGHLAPDHWCARSVCCVCGVVGHLAPVYLCARYLCCVCGVLGHLAPVHGCARPVYCVACAVSSATWLLFGGVSAWCVVLLVRCPRPLGSCSPVCPLGLLCCLCGVLSHLARFHHCARSVCCVACAVSSATWLLFTGVPARVFGCLCGVLGHLAPVHRCARPVCCLACAVSSATWLLFTSVPARCVVLPVRCPLPSGSFSPLCPLSVLCCVSGVLGHLAPGVPARYAVSAVSLAAWRLFTGVPARCIRLRERCAWPLGCCSRVCPLGVLCCICGVLGHLAPVQRCANVVCCLACAASSSTWILLTGVPARCVACVVSLAIWLMFTGVLVGSGVCAVSLAAWRQFVGLPARCVVLWVQFPWPVGSCSPVCAVGVLCWPWGVLGHLAAVQRCARSVCCVCGEPRHLAPVHRCGRSVCCVALPCPWTPGSCSPVCTLGVLCVRCP